jgi:glycosyltransferase involved in cell wall biosynthesis
LAAIPDFYWRPALNMKKVLFVFPDMDQGGRHIAPALSKELKNHFDCRLVIFKNVQHYTFHGKIYDIKSPTSKNPFKVLYHIIKRILLIGRIVKKEEIDILFAHALISNFICVLVKKYFRLNIPLILTFHTPLEMGIKDMGIAGRISKRIIINNKKYINKIICVSEGLRKEVFNLGFPMNLIETIYNPVDIDTIRKSIQPMPDKDMASMKKNSSAVILSAGRLAKAKNYYLLLEAFEIVRKKINSKLIIIGEGSLKNDLIKKAEDLGISRDVTFPGWKNNPFNWIAHADVFVLSSSWEAFGNVIVEAFACNTPVISTDCPVGPGEIITHGIDGLLANPFDKHDLAEKILYLLSDKNLYNSLRKNGMKRANDFKINNQIQSYIKAIDALCN